MTNIKHDFYKIYNTNKSLYNKLYRIKKWLNIKLTNEWFNIEDLLYIHENRYFIS